VTGGKLHGPSAGIDEPAAATMPGVMVPSGRITHNPPITDSVTTYEPEAVTSTSSAKTTGNQAKLTLLVSDAVKLRVRPFHP
jgi:hypothetical protein